MPSHNTLTSTQEWKLHWPLVLAAAFGFSYHSVASYSMGLFMEPLSNEFGWGRMEISMGLFIAALVSVPLSPLAGAMIDRWGARRLAIPGLALKIVCLALFATATSSLTQWYALWFLFALITLATQSTIWTFAVSSVFDSARGTSLAITLSGTAIAQVLVPPITEMLITHVGWRAAYVALGIGWGAPALLLAYLFLFDGYAGRRSNRRNKIEQPTLPGLTVQEALKSRPLIRVAIATLITMIFTIGVIVHQVPILTEAGVTRSNAALLASLAGVAGIVGKLCTGYFLDRFDSGWVGGSTLAVAAVAFVLLLEPFQSIVTIVIAMIIIGYTSGCKLQICAFLTGKYAGMRNFGKIFGFMASLIALGGSLGPALAGGIYDQTGSYSLLILASIPASLISGALLIALGPFPIWPKAVERAPANNLNPSGV